MEVTRKFTAMMITLIVLTLIGFVGVSKLLGPQSSEKADQIARHSSASQFSPGSGDRPLTEKEVAEELSAKQQLLDQIAQAVRENNWKEARKLFGEFQRRADWLPSLQSETIDLSPLLQDFYDYYKVSLERALNAQTAQTATLAINQLYGIIGEQRARLKKQNLVPELQRVRFLARELELWEKADDEKMIAVRAEALRMAWQEAKPLLIARRTPAQAVRNFDDLMERLTADTPTKGLKELIAACLQQLDQLEQPALGKAVSGQTGKSESVHAPDAN